MSQLDNGFGDAFITYEYLKDAASPEDGERRLEDLYRARSTLGRWVIFGQAGADVWAVHRRSLSIRWCVEHTPADQRFTQTFRDYMLYKYGTDAAVDVGSSVALSLVPVGGEVKWARTLVGAGRYAKVARWFAEHPTVARTSANALEALREANGVRERAEIFRRYFGNLRELQRELEWALDFRWPGPLPRGVIERKLKELDRRSPVAPEARDDYLAALPPDRAPTAADQRSKLLRRLATARRLHSQPARKLALLDYRSTYPGGVVLSSTGRASEPRAGEKRSVRRLQQAARAGRSNAAQARAAAIARARAGGRYHDPLAWLPQAIAAAQASAVSAAATKTGIAGAAYAESIWADRNAKIAGGGR